MIHFFEKSAPGIRDEFAVKRLFLPRAGVELPALQLGGSQLPVALAPGDQMPSFGLPGHHNTHVQTNTN